MPSAVVLRAISFVAAVTLVYVAMPRLYAEFVFHEIEAEVDVLEKTLRFREVYREQAESLDTLETLVPYDPQIALLRVRLAAKSARLASDEGYEAATLEGLNDLLSVVPGDPDYWVYYATGSTDPDLIATALEMSLRQGTYDPSAAIRRFKVAARNWEELPADLQAKMSQQIEYLWSIREERMVANVYLLASPAMRDVIVASIPQTFGQQKKLAQLTGQLSIVVD